MSGKYPTVRRSQVITTWGPGALIDLPRHAGIVGSLEVWPHPGELEEIVDQRITQKLALLLGIAAPKLLAPPPDDAAPGEKDQGIGVRRFPEWFLVQEKTSQNESVRSRRLIHRRALDEKTKRFEGLEAVPTRFVRACPRGHVADLPWRRFVHQAKDNGCMQQLWLDEQGTGGDLGDLTVRCECGAKRGLHEAAEFESFTLGRCPGARPWIGWDAREECELPSRLLIRTAANAYFPQVLSALSLPDKQTGLTKVVAELWDFLEMVDDEGELALFKKKPKIAAKLVDHDDVDVVAAIKELKGGGAAERPVKQVELDAILDVPEGFGDDVPVDPNFHARRLPQQIWRKSSLGDPIAAVIQVHRLREVLALTGFTRFEAVVPDIDGEYDTDVERAQLADEPTWFPAVENRGEGVFLLLDALAVKDWLSRIEVQQRIDRLRDGFDRWAAEREVERPYPGGPYVLLHTLSHLLLQSLSLRCGYPASSIRERIYIDTEGDRYGLMLYTASSDSEGTLGGLVQQARDLETHLATALRSGGLCSNDPICAQHTPGEGFEARWLHGAACHGCALIAETSCEMRNDHLDRALVVPTLAVPDAAFFSPVP
ncbi:MAG: DrmB family protein [Solirubrobacterales bacterium]